MALDLNVSPFYDDYSEDKKFYRILFRPGYAVQARELTQLQTIIQQQVKRFGDHVFKQGSMVIPGQIAYDTDVHFVKLINYTGIDTFLISVLGKEIKNENGLVAEVVNYALASGSDSDTIFLKYKNSVQDGFGQNITSFSVNSVLSAVDDTIPGSITCDDIGLPNGLASSATITKGVYYINDNFVLVDGQNIILDKYSNTPSYKVGLQLTESIVYPEDDESLLDNALGSPNYAAPGAARYYMDLELTKIELDETEPDNFIELLRLKNGIVEFKIDRSQYAELEKTLARRTYDESGDYALTPFNVQSRNYRSNFRDNWAPGEIYIQGDVIRTPINASPESYYFTAVAGVQGGESNSAEGGVSANAAPSWSTTADNVVDGEITWEYTPLPNFNQGVYSFTSGDVAFENLTLDDHVRLDGMLAYGVEAGKAYVRGYEIEKLATQYLAANKSRDLPAGSESLADFLGIELFNRSELTNGLDPVVNSVSSLRTVNIDTSMGSYVLVKNVKFAPNLASLPQINLYSVVKASAIAADSIGKARIRAIEFHGTLEGIPVYKLFLFDIQMDANKYFNDVKAIGSLTGTYAFISDSFIPSGETSLTLNNPRTTSLIHSLPDYAIKEIVEMDYTVVVPFQQQSSDASGILTLTAPSGGYTFESTAQSGNYIVVGLNTTTNPGDVVIPTSIIGGGGTVVTITCPEAAAKLYTVFATLKRSNAVNATASAAVVDTQEIFATSETARLQEIFLSKSYGIRIVSIKMASSGFGGGARDINVTNRYYFKSNADTSSIGRVSILLQDGAPLPTGSIEVNYEYLDITQNSPGNVLAVNTYVAPNSGLRYDQISSLNGIQLRDAIDFRPRASSTDYFDNYFPKYGETSTIQYNHYLPRIDSVSLTSTGKFITNAGTPSLKAIEQNIPANSMKLARISLEPYTFGVDSNSVRIDRVENKRYTMRDIGKLERRVQDLEYYTSLTMLELDTKNMRVVDSNGLDRFQNGFIVDTFDGQGVGNSFSPEWNASVDSTKKELRPFFNQRQVDLLENVNKVNKTYQVSGDLITLPFSEVSLISQPKASRRESVNPYDLYTYTGVLSLTPWSDTWFSTERRPDIIINDEGQYNAIVSMAEDQGVLGTVWNSWQTVFSSTKSLGERMDTLNKWSSANTTILNDGNNGGTFWRARSTFTADELAAIGIDPALAGNQSALNSSRAGGLRVITIETEATETTAARSGVRSFVVDSVDSRVLEDRVVDTKIVPYIRPRALLVRGFGFKASTRMYNFFDGTNVDRYLQCATRIKYTQITGKHDTFTTTKNCGSNVKNSERLVSYSTGLYITGTATVTNGSTAVTGSTTSFTTEITAGDTFFIGDDAYIVATVTDNTSLTLANAYTGITAVDTAATVKSTKHSNLEVELAFSHGEVIKEYNASNVATGRTAIVVGQEIVKVGTVSNYYIWVLNERGDNKYSTAPGYYFEGEYTDHLGTKPRVNFVDRTEFSNLTSSETGQVNGIFRIPNNPIDKFRTGTREYRLTDSPSNNIVDTTTSSSTYYQANGLIEVKQRTIISTRTAEIVSEVVSDNKTIINVADRITDDSGWFDPLAQTFLVQNDGGCFITSVDLFFASVDLTGKIPVRVEIREVINGYPGKVVLPFSRVQKQAGEVNTDSQFASVATNFKFSSPVYLQNGSEYALTVLSDSSAYELWIAQTLETEVTGSKTVINSQPYNGVLFKSQNASTWTADQTQDMMFKIYRADFTATSTDIEFIPPANKAKPLGFNPFNFIENGTQFRVNHRDHGFRALDTVTYTNRQITTFVNGIPAAYLFNTPLTVSKIETDMYMVEMSNILPRSTTNLASEAGTKTFTNFTNYVQSKFATFRAGSTVIRFTRYDLANDTIYDNTYMEGTITSTSLTGITMNVTSIGSVEGTFNSWILSSISSGQVGGSYISATENYEFQTVMMAGNTNVLPETAINFTLKTLTREEDPEYNDIQLKENIDLFQERVLPSAQNYQQSLLPMLVTAKLTTTNTSLSPVIDLSGVALTLVNNKIDNPTASANDPTLDYILIAASIELEAGGAATLVVGDGDTRTVVVNSVVNSGANLALYNDLNRLRIGNVCRFIYSEVTGGYYQAISNKYFDAAGNIYLEFEPEIDPNTGNLSEALVETTTNTVTINWLSHYVSEIAPFGGTVTSKYVTKKINFARPSDMMQVMFAAIIPSGTDVDVYYKTGLNSEGYFENTGYRKLAPFSGYSKNDNEFKDITFRAEDLAPYDTIVVKLVMRSNDKSKVPRIKDLRVISCAA